MTDMSITDDTAASTLESTAANLLRLDAEINAAIDNDWNDKRVDELIDQKTAVIDEIRTAMVYTDTTHFRFENADGALLIQLAIAVSITPPKGTIYVKNDFS